jgi:methylthioribose-1-phosphate isomerase
MRAIDWVDGHIRFLDQTLLPHEERFVDTDNVAVVAEAIRKLRIRGAPAIGVAAGFGVVVAARSSAMRSHADQRTCILDAITELAGTRPTAVNLFHALDRMRNVMDRSSGAAGPALAEMLLAEAQRIQEEDIRACDRIGEHGAALLSGRVSLLTHCNAGALATAGSGTALSVIGTAARQGKVIRVFVDETRPLLQGARLTAWELQRAGIAVVLITDSTAASVLREGKVDAVITGADRIAANGDAANKIGTYPLAVLARHHGVPFYVAAPLSTIDIALPSGDSIPIEERGASEVTDVAGVRVAPSGIGVYAPAFDVTPNGLITGIVTEAGVLFPPFNHSIAEVFRAG